MTIRVRSSCVYLCPFVFGFDISKIKNDKHGPKSVKMNFTAYGPLICRCKLLMKRNLTLYRTKYMRICVKPVKINLTASASLKTYFILFLYLVP